MPLGGMLQPGQVINRPNRVRPTLEPLTPEVLKTKILQLRLETISHAHDRLQIPLLVSTATSAFATIDNDRTGFGLLGTIYLGTPAQKVSLQVDFSQSDIWVPSAIDYSCEIGSSIELACAITGTYNESASGTHQGPLGIPKVIDDAFGSGTYVRIAEHRDVLSFPGREETLALLNTGFGIRIDGTTPYGRLGLLHRSRATAKVPESFGKGVGSAVVDKMVVRRELGVSAFSFFTDGNPSLVDYRYATMIFGAVDTTKFTGSLEVMPTSEHISRTVRLPPVRMGRIYLREFTDSTGTTELPSKILHTPTDDRPFEVAFEPDRAWSHLPYTIALRLVQAMTDHYNFDSRTGRFYIPCRRNSPTGRTSPIYKNKVFEIEFWKGVKIPVMPQSLVSYIGDSPAGKPICALAANVLPDPRPLTRAQQLGQSRKPTGFRPQGAGKEEHIPLDYFSIGAPFLRYAYLVFDSDNNRISVAPLDINSGNRSDEIHGDDPLQVITDKMTVNFKGDRETQDPGLEVFLASSDIFQPTISEREALKTVTSADETNFIHSRANSLLLYSEVNELNLFMIFASTVLTYLAFCMYRALKRKRRESQFVKRERLE
ncbi:aspartic peptidase domain-containing protein [Lipomyces oligophaga]|uniref:aspartic peptidase domain-containing protein n=1 Tax=Lipomyces oligophaga TaxID=45792 RepID=UPI0034CF0BD8